MRKGEAIHATCVVIGEAGILIRGPSGSGKSALARELIYEAGRAGRFARLVSDDRTRVHAASGRLLAQAVDAIAGQIEARGVGILTFPFERRAVIRLVIELESAPSPRLPDETDETTTLCGVILPRLRQGATMRLTDIVLNRTHAVDESLMTV